MSPILPNGAESHQDWPRSVALVGPHGKVTIEAHAPWCPHEQTRALLSGRDGIAWPGLHVECKCDSAIEREKFGPFLGVAS